MEFRPNDAGAGYQILPPQTKVVNVDRIQGFRFPAPGSRHGARIPIRETEEDVYDIKEYTRDPRNLPPDVRFIIPPRFY